MKSLRVFTYQVDPLTTQTIGVVVSLEDFAEKHPTLAKNAENDSMVESDELECKYAFFSNRKEAPAFKRMNSFIEDIETIKDAAFEDANDF